MITAALFLEIGYIIKAPWHYYMLVCVYCFIRTLILFAKAYDQERDDVKWL